MMRRVLVLGCLALACGDSTGDGTGSADSGDGTATTALATTTTGGASTSGSASTGAGTTASDSTTGPMVPLCPSLAFSLVVDRNAPVYSEARRAALAGFFDDVATQTGATVRILANTGSESPLAPTCAGLDDDLVLSWDDNGPGTLDCLLDATAASSGPADYMFSGLMFPILADQGWPPPGSSVSVAMLLARSDDDQGGMYARPGMASEAFLRLAGGDDRRRVLALTGGRDADQLNTFAVSINADSQHADWDDAALDVALAQWLPSVVSACESYDAPPDPPTPGGCTHLDVLFVVDGSVSMDAERSALRGLGGEPPVFADFTDALLAEIDTLVDVRVGVVSSAPADHKLHAHLDMPSVPPGPSTDCGLVPGEPWAVGPSPTLESEFACIAGTLQDATTETTALNAASALLHPANAGFIRNDSVVFVVMITDEDTQGFEASRMKIRQQILAAVDDNLGRLVVLGIAGDQGVFEMPKTTCAGVYGAAVPGRRLTSIVNSFREQGHMQDLCAGELADVFSTVLADVVEACMHVPPAG